MDTEKFTQASSSSQSNNMASGQIEVEYPQTKKRIARTTLTRAQLNELNNMASKIGRYPNPNTKFTSIQATELEYEFTKNIHMNQRERVICAQRLGLEEAQVKDWFQNRRMKLKRKNKLENPNIIQKQDDSSSNTEIPSHNTEKIMEATLVFRDSKPYLRIKRV